MWLLCAAMLPATLQAQFKFITNNNAITITDYTGPGGNVTIPSTTNGYPVTTIGTNAFYNKTTLTGVVIPDSVTSIRSNGFYSCSGLTNVTIGNGVTSFGRHAFGSGTSSLTSVCFRGNAPTPDSTLFITNVFSYGPSLATVHSRSAKYMRARQKAHFYQCAGMPRTPNGSRVKFAPLPPGPVRSTTLFGTFSARSAHWRSRLVLAGQESNGE